MSIVCTSDKYGLSVADITTGAYFVTEVEGERKLTDEITRYMPAEIICNQAFQMCGVDLEDIKGRLAFPFLRWTTGIRR